MADKVYTQGTSGEAGKVFLEKLQKRVQTGEFDEHLTMPFVNKENLWKVISGKLSAKIESGSTPTLSDKEIVEIIKDLKEAAGFTFHILQENGFFDQDENGRVVLSEKGKKALRQVPLL